MMNTEEAFRAIQRQAPCPHNSIDTSLGDGRTWAKCHDCGLMFKRGLLAQYIDAADKFDDAIAHLRDLLSAKGTT